MGLSVFLRLCLVWIVCLVCYGGVYVVSSGVWGEFLWACVYYAPHAGICAVLLLCAVWMFRVGEQAYAMEAVFRSAPWSLRVPVLGFVLVVVVACSAVYEWVLPSSSVEAPGQSRVLMVQRERKQSRVALREILDVVAQGNYEYASALVSQSLANSSDPFVFGYLSNVLERVQYDDSVMTNEGFSKIERFDVGLKLLALKEYHKAEKFFQNFQNTVALYFSERIQDMIEYGALVSDQSRYAFQVQLLLKLVRKALQWDIVGQDEYVELLLYFNSLFPDSLALHEALGAAKLEAPFFVAQSNLDALFRADSQKNLYFLEEHLVLEAHGRRYSLEKTLCVASQVAFFRDALFFKDLLLFPLNFKAPLYRLGYAKLVGSTLFFSQGRGLSAQNTLPNTESGVLLLSRELDLAELFYVYASTQQLASLSSQELVNVMGIQSPLAASARVVLVERSAYYLSMLLLFVCAVSLGFRQRSEYQHSARLGRVRKVLLFFMCLGLVWFVFESVRKFVLILFDRVFIFSIILVLYIV